MSNIGRNRKVFVLHSNDSSRHGASRPTLTELRCKRCKGIKDSTKKYHFLRLAQTRVCILFWWRRVFQEKQCRPRFLTLSEYFWQNHSHSRWLSLIWCQNKCFRSLLNSPYLISMFTRYRKHHKTSPRYLPRPFHLHLPKKWELQVHICVCYSFKYCFSK